MLENPTSTDTTTSSATDVTSVLLTDNAAKRIAALAAQDNKPSSCLRISVDGGGCSGFKYNYDFGVHVATADDLVLKKEDAQVLIDSMSLEFLKGCTIDYVETLGNAGFEIVNPNASVRCGCGNSFSV